MDETTLSGAAAPFASSYRGAGVLLHVTALPGPYGIGDVGPIACAWIDRLVEAGQSWWQVLPLGPTGKRFSPYEPLSSFAGNPLLISPEWLIEDGLLRQSDLQPMTNPGAFVAYERVIPYKQYLLDQAWDRFRAGERPDLGAEFEQFCHDRADWLDDFALFMALKARFGDAPYPEWPAPLARHEIPALRQIQGELAVTADRVRFGQFIAARQWGRLRDYARSRHIKLMGDLPIFVSLDSCDAWAHRELFLLGDDCRPQVLSGVPPDYFSPHGQLWGNPLYDWSALEQSGYRWWLDRLHSQLEWLDLVRLDHFRAFEAAWHVPATATTAKEGEWRPGPGAKFFRALEQHLHGLPFVAEDLGLITDAVRELRDQVHLPGMRVLQFAFDGDETNPFLPHNYVSNTVVYTGTHDNDTTRGWYEALDSQVRDTVDAYLARSVAPESEIAWKFVRLAWKSIAALAIVPLQDLHNLDTSARFNRPGEPDGNWRWRAVGDLLPGELVARLARLTEECNRRPAPSTFFLRHPSRMGKGE